MKNKDLMSSLKGRDNKCYFKQQEGIINFILNNGKEAKPNE